MSIENRIHRKAADKVSALLNAGADWLETATNLIPADTAAKQGCESNRLAMRRELPLALAEHAALCAVAEAAKVALGALEDIRTGKNPNAGTFARVDLEQSLSALSTIRKG